MTSHKEEVGGIGQTLTLGHEWGQKMSKSHDPWKLLCDVTSKNLLKSKYTWPSSYNLLCSLKRHVTSNKLFFKTCINVFTCWSFSILPQATFWHPSFHLCQLVFNLWILRHISRVHCILKLYCLISSVHWEW